jgi:hypothetical protein
LIARTLQAFGTLLTPKEKLANCEREKGEEGEKRIAERRGRAKMPSTVPAPSPFSNSASSHTLIWDYVHYILVSRILVEKDFDKGPSMFFVIFLIHSTEEHVR